jgi:hypothetical protein
MWMFLWLMVALKVPICALLYLVWWASRPPEPADTSGSEDWKKPRIGPDHPRPRKPGPSRRGPHGDPLPRPPARVRLLRGRTLRKAAHGK